MRLLFWNTNKRRIHELVAALAKEHSIDIVIIAEPGFDANDLTRTINRQNPRPYHQVRGHSARVDLYSRLPRSAVRMQLDSQHLSVQRVIPLIGEEFLLATLHLPSKLHHESGDLAALAGRYVRKILEVESLVDHSRTVVVGDFNMNPFDGGMLSCEGFHAVAVRRIAEQGDRQVSGERRAYFYNPMWSFFADQHDERPRGSYYHSSPGVRALFWNLPDQVLVRPDLLRCWDNSSVRLLTSVGEQSIVRNDGRPNPRIASDHLPLLFDLAIERAMFDDEKAEFVG